MTKIVEFPKDKIVRESNLNIGELEKAKEKRLQNFADAVIDDIVESIMAELDQYGINTETEEFDKDFSFSIDSLRSTVYRTLGIPHQLHEFMQKNVTIIKAKSQAEAIKMAKQELQKTETNERGGSTPAQ